MPETFEALDKGGILMPLDDYQSFLNTPASRGPRGGLRIDYEALGGRYMSEKPFIDLIRASYIGTFANDTISLQAIVRAILADGGAVHHGDPFRGAPTPEAR